MLGQASSSKGRIIIQDCEEEEEAERFNPSVQQHSSLSNCLSQRGSISLSGYKISAFLVPLFLLISLWLFHQNYALRNTLEGQLQLSDQLLLLQTSIINYQPSPYPIPHNKTFLIDKVKSADLYKFQRMVARFLIPFTDTDCQLKRYGSAADGGYVLCQNFVNHSTVLLNFGIEKEDAFGCDILDHHTHLTNYQLDCTQQTQKKCPLSNQTHFSPLCVGQQDITINNQQYNRMDTIIDKLKVDEASLIVKMDVEGSEWHALARTPTEILEKTDQLIIEIHLNKVQKGPSWHHLGLIRSLSSKFIPVNAHINNYDCFGLFQPLHYLRASSIQVTLVNRRLITLHSHHRSFKPNPLNAPNSPSRADCQQS